MITTEDQKLNPVKTLLTVVAAILITISIYLYSINQSEQPIYSLLGALIAIYLLSDYIINCLRSQTIYFPRKLERSEDEFWFFSWLSSQIFSLILFIIIFIWSLILLF